MQNLLLEKLAILKPKSIQCLKNYSKADFLSDLLAGVTVGLVALPLAMAFAIASNVPPESGIYCAIIAGFIISALGGCRTQIGGPTGAFVVVVSAIVAQHGIDGLFMCTFMAGLMLIAMGVSGFGSVIKFIPRPVVVGFTNGIAVLIASTQLKDFLGLKVEHLPGDFIGRISVVFHNIGTFSIASFAVASVSLLGLLIFRKYLPKFPGSIVILIFGTALAHLFRLDVPTIRSQFGEIPTGLPTLTIPSFNPQIMLQLLSPAITVAMLGAIESLLSAVVSDRLSGDKHNPNAELFAQGVANVFSPLFGGLPATGAIARTATNVKSGARTPVAGMLHAITLLVILLSAAPLAGQIPLAILSAILLVVAYNMGEWREVPEILKLNTSSIVVWAITFILTVFADLTVAVEVGLAMAAFIYIRKVTDTTTVVKITPEHVRADAEHSLHLNPIPDGAVMYRIHGPFLFGATEKFQKIYDEINSLPKVVILRLRNMNAIDATGLHAFENLAEALRQSGRTMLICGMRDQPKKMFANAEFHQSIGKDNICDSLKLAVQRAKELLALKDEPTNHS